MNLIDCCVTISELFDNKNNIVIDKVINKDIEQMDLTTPRRPTDGVSDLQKTTNNQHRVAKSVFSIRSLVDVEDADNLQRENIQHTGEFINFIFILN